MNQEHFEQIKQINHIIRQINKLYSRWAQKHDTNQYTLSILHMLVTEEKFTQKKFIESHDVPKQSVNNVILDLKRNGLIEMIPSEEDKREKYIVLTDAGKKYSKKLLSPLFLLESEVVEAMSQESMTYLLGSMEKFEKILEEKMNLEEVKEGRK